MKTKDKSRKWMWWFLAVVVALQLYFVQELIAAFLLFAICFAVIALALGSVYIVVRTWASLVERLANSQHPVMVKTRSSIDAIEDLALRPLRRPGSAAAR